MNLTLTKLSETSFENEQESINIKGIQFDQVVLSDNSNMPLNGLYSLNVESGKNINPVFHIAAREGIVRVATMPEIALSMIKEDLGLVAFNPEIIPQIALTPLAKNTYNSLN